MNTEERLDNHEERIVRLERDIATIRDATTSLRSEMASGFADIKADLALVYEERRKWAEWARANLPPCLKHIGKWIVIITLIAIAGGNLKPILDWFRAGAAQ